jgi:hypothetical protein
MKVAILSYEGVVKSCVYGPAGILDGIGTFLHSARWKVSLTVGGSRPWSQSGGHPSG